MVIQDLSGLSPDAELQILKAETRAYEISAELLTRGGVSTPALVVGLMRALLTIVASHPNELQRVMVPALRRALVVPRSADDSAVSSTVQ